MALDNHNQKALDAFLNAIKDNLPAYEHSCFNFIAVKREEIFELYQGRLLLNCTPVLTPSFHFQSKNIRAGVYKLEELKLNPTSFMENVLSGIINTPHGELHFPAQKGQSYSLWFNPFHTDGILLQQRRAHLNISGEHRGRQLIHDAMLDWELRAAATPFDGVQDLCNECFVSPVVGDLMNIEVTAFNVAGVDAKSSVQGTKAQIGLNLAKGLDIKKASLGYRIMEKNKIVKRGVFGDTAFSWKELEQYQQGTVETVIPLGAIIHCIANYAENTQNFYWLADPSTAQNPLRAAFQNFDKQLEVLQELITKTYVKGQNAREFETGIARLLWLLGFSVAHMGGTSKTSDAPDLIATTPQGNFAIIECTTGLLKAENKLSILVERTEKVRKSLALSGNQHLRVLPVIFTAKTLDEVKADLEQAQNLGVYVVTREAFDGLIRRSLIIPDANQLYAEAERTLQRTQTPSML